MIINLIFKNFIFIYSRNHLKINLESQIWKKATHTIGLCKLYNTITTMSQTHLTDIIYSFDHFTQPARSEVIALGQAVAAIIPFGIHIGSLFQNVKHVIVNAISTQSVVSVNKASSIPSIHHHLI